MDIIFNLIQALYATTGIVALIGYFPTIVDLIKKIPSANANSYLIWTLSNFIAFAYATLIVKDLLFSVVAGINFVCCFLILFLSIKVHNSKKNNLLYKTNKSSI